MHPRRRCINAFADILLGNPQPPEPEAPVYPIEEVKNRIYKNRRSALWAPEFPCICLFALNEDAKTDAEPKYYERKLMLIAEICVRAVEGSDEQCDDIALKIENLILHQRFLPDPTYQYAPGESPLPPELDPAATSDNIKMVGSAINLVDENHGADITTCRIAFEIDYNSSPNYGAPDHNFNTMSAKYRIPGKDSHTLTADDLKTNIYQGD